MNNDKIVSIKKIGKRKTIDISVENDNLFYANCILTHNSGYGESDLDLTNIADSIGTTGTADIIFGISQSDEMRVAGRYLFTLLKNRYGLNKMQSMIGVDYNKMRLFEVSDDNEDSNLQETNHGVPVTPAGTSSNTIVDETAVDIIKTLKGNRTANKNKIMNKKPNNNKDIQM